MVVRHCQAVNDTQIRAEIAAGAMDAETLADRCGAGSECGGCYVIDQVGVENYLAQQIRD